MRIMITIFAIISHNHHGYHWLWSSWLIGVQWNCIISQGPNPKQPDAQPAIVMETTEEKM